jgi:2'-5' RNA ligase
MSLPSYSDVFSIVHERAHDEEIRAGDLVRTGENFHPHFTVIAVSGDKAWVRNVQNGVDSLAQLDRCRRIADVDVALGVAVAAE